MFIVSPSGNVVKAIERAVTLLKMSGMAKVAVSNELSTIDGEEAIFIIDYALFNQNCEIIKNIKRSVAIIYENTAFKSIFSKRICKICTYEHKDYSKFYF